MNEPSNSVFLVLAIKMWVIRPGSADMQKTHWALYSNNSLWGSIRVNKDLPTKRTHSLLNNTLQNIQLCFTAVRFCLFVCNARDWKATQDLLHTRQYSTTKHRNLRNQKQKKSIVWNFRKMYVIWVRIYLFSSWQT